MDKELREFGDYRILDIFLNFNIDNVNKILHMELRSYSSNDIAKRTLMYGLSKAVLDKCEYGLEKYTLLCSVIVNVRKFKNSDKNYRNITLSLFDKEFNLTYPVIQADKRIKEIFMNIS